MVVMMKLFLILFFFICLASGYPGWKHGYKPTHWNYQNGNDWYNQQYDNGPRPHYGRPAKSEKETNSGGAVDPRRSGNNGCACVFYVQRTEVFRRNADTGSYSCDQGGLQRCTAYCSNLFSSEGLQATARQEACDVLGRPVNSSWYRRDRICGIRGQFKDTREPRDLCCVGGRTVTCA